MSTANGTFLDKYKSNQYTVTNSYNPTFTQSVPSNLNNYQFYQNNSLAQEVISKAGPTHVYHRPGMHYEVSDVHRTNGEHRINEDHDPIHIVKPMESVKAKQNVKVRYLEPPPPPAPAPIIIRERQLTPPPPPPPIVIRQHAPKPPTPPPLIIREKPPTPPVIPQTQIIEKVIPPPTPPPRQVIIERYRQPEKPRDIVYEKWLPYKPLPERQVVVERTKTFERHPVPKNVIIEYEAPGVHVDKNIYHEGVIRADPHTYHQQSYGPGEIRLVDKITDLPLANTNMHYEPTWQTQSITQLPTQRPISVNQNVQPTPRGPVLYSSPWNTTYKTSYTARGFPTYPK